MKKEVENEMEDELRPEYDFAQMEGGVRSKYVERYCAGTNLVLLDPDETDSTIIVLNELKDIAEQAASRFSQLFSLQLRVADAQPTVPPDMLELVTQVIANTLQRVPALERSVEEIKIEWSLP